MLVHAHVTYWFQPEIKGFYITFIAPLTLGVEPFFVLGGYLAAFSFKKFAPNNSALFTFFDMKDYLKRRWLRTLPNYFLFLGLHVIAFNLFKQGFEFDSNYLIFTQNFYWLTPHFFSISWSLATQEWFYLLLPTAMLIAGVLLAKVKKINVLVFSSLILILIKRPS